METDTKGQSRKAFLNIESSALHFSLPPNDFLGLNYERIGKSGLHYMAGFCREQDFLKNMAGVKFLGGSMIGLSKWSITHLQHQTIIIIGDV